ncbi:Co2+/Mg2+ efflux protein ApaG [Pseudenhygromyxa sp. WMMC2535]|uniref:Co2+/Mg2+ efflux protein ApaG n=1 Tax=Pseudenhygromyxa sp. WMMC2535 TaxID=2712867 RepID=UPI0015580E3A|nr:Co2+/Mg2+ efflux protein ApaG [Pseudenhygromyxa sp. WMMC2535]NVB40454.1 Co2+/Mg2+ efflux protein ApaG [Pseudenhygromyxa sp. WMMC2535]
MPEISETTSRGIVVRVQAYYVPERSQPRDGLWFFAYQVGIENCGDETVKLLSRHWIITDSNGNTEEVRGPGVVGEQPVLQPGARFQYTSACPLPTPFGTMHGSYQMITDEGETFDAKIAPFSLNLPNAVN